MRILIANSLSAVIHIVAIGGLAMWSADQDWLQYQVTNGQPIFLEFAPAPSPATAEIQPVILEVAPAPIDTPLPRAEPAATSLAVYRQAPLVEIGEEVASAEAPPAEAPPNPTAAAALLDQQPPELTDPKPPIQPQRTPTPDLPEFQTAALPAPAATEAGATTVDRLPRKLPQNPAPPYPEDAWRARIQGRVVLKVLVEASGLVGAASVHASSGSASLDEAALTTVRTWRFEPARRGGSAATHEVLVPVRFTIVPN